MFVMLLLSVITQIPELNMSKLFSLDGKNSSDPERQLLAASGGGVGGAVIASSAGLNSSSSPKYSRQVDEDDSSSISHVNRTAALGEEQSSQ